MTMEGYQFAHMQIHSVKGTPGAGPHVTAKRKNDERGWAAAAIFDEAERKTMASMHVVKGGPPPEIMIAAVDNFDAARAAHLAAVSKKETFPYTAKDGTVSERSRKLRADAPSLYSCVVSLPVLTVDALADATLRATCREVLDKAMEHERRRLEPLGGQILMGVLHWDEPHVHAHIFALSPEKGRVENFHPGRVAKRKFHDEVDEAMYSRADRAKAGNREYCDAMRKWQDEIHDGVFSAAGLLRFGPRRARMSNADYRKFMKAKAAQAVDAARSAELASAIESQAGVLAQLEKKADGAAAQMSRQRAEIEAARADVRRREAEAAASAAEARESIERGKALKDDAEARARAVTIGCDAVLTRRIDFREATETKAEGLRFGPAAPKESSARDALRAAIVPAYDFLVRLARSLFLQRQAEKKEREALKMETARQEREAAELRRRAAVLASDLGAAGRRVPLSLVDIASGRQAALNEDSFPGAWALERETTMEVISKRLDATTNLDLRAAHQATRDAALICEDDAKLRAKFEYGLKIIKLAAAQRGFDLESGRQDLAKAKSPELAARHRDQLPGPVKIRKAQTVRERGLGD